MRREARARILGRCRARMSQQITARSSDPESRPNMRVHHFHRPLLHPPRHPLQAVSPGYPGSSGESKPYYIRTTSALTWMQPRADNQILHIARSCIVKSSCIQRFQWLAPSATASCPRRAAKTTTTATATMMKPATKAASRT